MKKNTVTGRRRNDCIRILLSKIVVANFSIIRDKSITSGQYPADLLIQAGIAQYARMQCKLCMLHLIKKCLLYGSCGYGTGKAGQKNYQKDNIDGRKFLAQEMGSK